MNENEIQGHAAAALRMAGRALEEAQTSAQIEAACLAADYAMAAKARADEGDLQSVKMLRGWVAAEYQRVRFCKDQP